MQVGVKRGGGEGLRGRGRESFCFNSFRIDAVLPM